MCLAPSIHLTKQGDSTQGNETLSLHVCIKCVSFEENEFALVAIKCQIVFVSVSRRCRSDVVHSLPILMVSIDLTDLTLVSDDT